MRAWGELVAVRYHGYDPGGVKTHANTKADAEMAVKYGVQY